MMTYLPPFRASTMKGLYSKVIAGKYDPIPAHFSQDLKNMLKQTLIVNPRDRSTCDQILALPGLLSHLTGTLDDIEALKEETESLLNTIKLPSKLTQITNIMPASQYH